MSNLFELIDKDQTGTKFGAVIEAIDITGDGYDELLVASPLYSGYKPDEGRVFVYTTTTSVNQPCISLTIFRYDRGPHLEWYEYVMYE